MDTPPAQDVSPIPVSNLPLPASTSPERRAGPRANFTAVVRGVSKNINPEQLKNELGGVDIFTSAGTGGSTVVLANIEQNRLDLAVSAHTAKDSRQDAIVMLREKAKTDTTIAAILDVLGIV